MKLHQWLRVGALAARQLMAPLELPPVPHLPQMTSSLSAWLRLGAGALAALVALVRRKPLPCMQVPPLLLPAPLSPHRPWAGPSNRTHFFLLLLIGLLRTLRARCYTYHSSSSTALFWPIQLL